MSGEGLRPGGNGRQAVMATRVEPGAAMPRWARIMPAWGWWAAMLSAGLVWSYWTTLQELALNWWEDSDYSAGVLVGPIAGYVVWTRWKGLAAIPIRRCWWGLAVLAAAQVARLAGTYWMYGSL